MVSTVTAKLIHHALSVIAFATAATRKIVPETAWKASAKLATAYIKVANAPATIILAMRRQPAAAARVMTERKNTLLVLVRLPMAANG